MARLMKKYTSTSPRNGSTSETAVARSSMVPPEPTGSAARPPSSSNTRPAIHAVSAICAPLNAARNHTLRSTNRSAMNVLSPTIHMPASGPQSTTADSPAVDERLHVPAPDRVADHMVSETRQITTHATKCPQSRAAVCGTWVARAATATRIVTAT